MSDCLNIVSSSINTGVTIEKLVIKGEKIIDAIKKVLDLFNGNWRTDKNKNFILEIANSETSTKTLTEGVEKNVSGWKLNTDKQANKVIIKGANYKARTTEQITGTNTESGKSFEIYMYHYFTFNDEGKIINSGDFGDATGMLLAVAPDEVE